MKYPKINKYGEKLYPCRVSELNTNTRFTVWWTNAQFEFADHLARTGGLCLVDGFGYFYRFTELKKAMKKAFKNNYWKERLTTPNRRRG
jgi:hypothetical protein